MTPAGAEWRRWWLWLSRGLEGPVLLLFGVAAPVVGYWLVATHEGVTPLANAAAQFLAIPFGPLAWALVGARWSSGQHGEAGLVTAWPAPRAAVWGAGALSQLTTAMAAGAAACLGMMIALGSVGAVNWGATIGDAAIAAVMLGVGYALMLAFGSAVGAWVPRRWAGVSAVLLPLIALVGATLPDASPPTRFGDLVGFLALNPFTWFDSKVNDAFGFGPFGGVFAWTLVASLVALAAAGAAVVAREWRWGGRERLWPRLSAAALVASLVALSVTALSVYPPTLALPSAQALAEASGPGISSELVTVRLSGGGVVASALIAPRGPGTLWVWLNPQLTVTGITRGGRPVRAEVGPNGLWGIGGTGTITIRYRGRILAAPTLVPQAAREVRQQFGQYSPVASGASALAAFTGPASDALPAGTWYPIPAQDLKDPGRPEVMRMGLNVVRTPAMPATVVSNISTNMVGRTVWSETTGLDLMAGALTPVHLPGAIIWTGPEQAASWRHLPPGAAWPAALARWERAASPGHPAEVVAAVWGPTPTTVMALGNPNPVLWATILHSPVVSDGLLGMLQSTVPQFAEAVDNIPPVVAADLWAHLSNRWISPTSPSILVPPREDWPATNALAALDSQYSITGAAVGVGASAPEPGGPNVLAGLTGSQVQRFFIGMKLLLAHGWPTAKEIDALRQTVRGGAR